MRRPLTLSVTLAIVAILAQAACQSTAPPGLSPAAQTAFTQTRVIQALDVIRDAAIAANEQASVAGCVPSAETSCPPLLSTATTRRIVQYHRSAIILVHEGGAGWRATVLAGLDEALVNLSPGDRAYVAPYAALLRALLQEATR